jgi:predicted nucleic acid-binding protein
VPDFVADTDCLVAAFCAWHEHHDAAWSELARRLGRGGRWHVAGQTFVEAYAVLTRLPPPHRLSPADAHALLETNLESAVVVALDASDLRNVLAGLRDRGLGGGLTYDALVLEAARKAGVRTLLTFNERDFARLDPEGIEIVRPGGGVPRTS